MIYYVWALTLKLSTGLRNNYLPISLLLSNHQSILSWVGKFPIIYLLRTMSISQPGYIVNIMTRFGINTTSSTSFPTTPMSQLDMQDPLPVPLSPSKQKTFMQIVGSILFLSTRSRPDLSFSVNYLSLFMTKASQHQLDLCYNLLIYIWCSRDLTLIFNGQLGINFFCW